MYCGKDFFAPEIILYFIMDLLAGGQQCRRPLPKRVKEKRMYGYIGRNSTVQKVALMVVRATAVLEHFYWI